MADDDKKKADGKKTDKAGKGQKAEKSPKAEAAAKGQKAAGGEKGPKVDKADKAGKGDKGEKVAKKPEERVTPRLRTHYDEVVRKGLTEKFGATRTRCKCQGLPRWCSISASVKAPPTARRSNRRLPISR